MSNATTKELIRVLEDEHQALCAGAFKTLDELLGKKEHLLEELIRFKSSEETLAKIKSKLTVNQTLLAAAIHGVRAARDRIAGLEEVREGLAIYDRGGQLAKVSTPVSTLKKKA
jgi:hypothetical protein